MSEIQGIIDECDEFIIITMKRKNSDENLVDVIMGCDPNGPMLDVLDNVVQDANDAKKLYNERSKTNGFKAESYSNKETGSRPSSPTNRT